MNCLIYETCSLSSNSNHEKLYHHRSLPSLYGRLNENNDNMMIERMIWYFLFQKLPEANSEIDLIREALKTLPTFTRSRQIQLSQFLRNLSRIGMTNLVLQLNACMLFLQRDSQFAKEYRKTPKTDLWKPFLEDSFVILSILPYVASIIRDNASEEKNLQGESWLDRLFGPVHPRHCISKHEILEHLDQDGGSLVSHSSCLIASSLSDPYICYSSALVAYSSPFSQISSCNDSTGDETALTKAVLAGIGSLMGTFWKRALLHPIEHPLSTSCESIEKWL